jgi:hypothetical protein
VLTARSAPPAPHASPARRFNLRECAHLAVAAVAPSMRLKIALELRLTGCEPCSAWMHSPLNWCGSIPRRASRTFAWLETALTAI